MKDAVGGSLLLNLVVIFTSVVILFFAGILTYSKAYKVKNKIIEVIERYDGKIMDTTNSAIIKSEVLDEINKELGAVGYKVVAERPDDARCSNDSSRGACHNLNTSNYNYCICKQTGASSAEVFEVITYVQFEFPVIGDLLTFPVKGETKVLGKNYDY